MRQVYGANRDADNAAGKWLARGVDMLLHRFPGLRVAYMDKKGNTQYSVLIKARDRAGDPMADLKSPSSHFTEEVYR
jgi:hypothetical protein